MAYLLSEINRRSLNEPEQFIADCDAIYMSRLEEAADKILVHREKSPVVLLAGPSGSGKTTTAMKLAEVLLKKGIRTSYISMDDYFYTIDPATVPRTETGEYDLESPLCMDMPLLNAHFTALKNGEAIDIPRYDFPTQSRSATESTHLQLGPDEIAVFEGIHAFNPMITAVHPEAFKLFISPSSDVVDEEGKLVFKGSWMRLLRRTVRDFNFRGTAACETLAKWAIVCDGEEKNINPYKHLADHTIDSSFAYEVPVLNNTVTDLFNAMPSDTPRYEELMSVLPAFERFADLSPDLLAEDALLREFVGGSKYSY